MTEFLKNLIKFGSKFQDAFASAEKKWFFTLGRRKKAKVSNQKNKKLNITPSKIKSTNNSKSNWIHIHGRGNDV